MSGTDPLTLLRDLYPLRLAPVSPDADALVERLRAELPFTVHTAASGREHNGWQVPDSWEVRRARILRGGELVYDGAEHPLGVIGYSRSFTGRVGLAELRRHLFHHPLLANARVYHCDLYYKPWRSDWGFSMPSDQIEALPDGEYDVELETSFEPGEMKTLVYDLEGEVADTIILNAHTCHAAQANDDIAGVVVGVEVMKRLSERPRRFSYRLVLAPEHLGTIFYLADMPAEERARLRYGVFLEMLGNDNRLALQGTFTGTSLIDRAAHHHLRFALPDYESFAFRDFVGNDETVWEAPGIEVPTISLCRYPYQEYHSDRDNDSIISAERLAESVETVLGIVGIVDGDRRMRRTWDSGLLALSNPRYDLYIDDADPAIRPTVDAERRAWKRLMDYLPRYFDGSRTLLEVAEEHNLPFPAVAEYVGRFSERDLVRLEP